MEAEGAKVLVELANYGALGLCLVLALVAIVLLDRDRTKIRQALAEESKARLDDAQAYLKLALELQEKTQGKIEKLEAVAQALKEQSHGR